MTEVDNVAQYWDVMPIHQKRRLLRFINAHRQKAANKLGLPEITMAELPFVGMQEVAHAGVLIGGKYGYVLKLRKWYK